MDKDLAFGIKHGPLLRSVCTARLLHKGLLLCCSERTKCTTFRVHLVLNCQGVILIRILPTNWSWSISRTSACHRYIGRVDSSFSRLLNLLGRVSTPKIIQSGFCPCACAFAFCAFQCSSRFPERLVFLHLAVQARCNSVLRLACPATQLAL